MRFLQANGPEIVKQLIRISKHLNDKGSIDRLARVNNRKFVSQNVSISWFSSQYIKWFNEHELTYLRFG